MMMAKLPGRRRTGQTGQGHSLCTCTFVYIFRTLHGDHKQTELNTFPPLPKPINQPVYLFIA